MKAKKFAAEEIEAGVRINKYLADAGVCSRRAADRFVEEGKVFIDGECAVAGSRVLPGQRVVFNGKELEKEEDLVLLALNKPRGIVCTSDRREPDNVVDFVNYGKRIYPIGRLDKDSEGLLLMTNDGDIVNKILRAGNYHEKEYIVKVNKMITKEFLQGMAGGVPILDTVTRPCKVEALDKYRFKVILTQGLNRQIRRMCEYFGYRVVHLQRVRIMNIRLGHLKVGDYRKLTPQELEELKVMIKKSSNTPVLHDKTRNDYSVTYAEAKPKSKEEPDREKTGRGKNRNV
ncbi:MAG: 23S rRNA pseudouridine(2604) synthase RluF [Lachnospiraceae bacterium]